MSDFYVGQKVVCVDDTNTNRGSAIPLWPLKSGVIYTISELGAPQTLHAGKMAERFSGPLVHLCEINRAACGCCGQVTGFDIRRFRPLVSKAISAFRKIAQDVTDGKYVEIKEDA